MVDMRARYNFHYYSAYTFGAKHISEIKLIYGEDSYLHCLKLS